MGQIEESINSDELVEWFSEGLTEQQKARYSKYCEELLDFIESNADDEGVIQSDVVTDFAGHGFAILRSIIQRETFNGDISISRVFDKYKSEWEKFINKSEGWDLLIAVKVADYFIPKQNTFTGNNKLKL